MNEKPGKFPFTRGIYSGMYQDRLWSMRQYAGFSSAEDSNKRFKFLLKDGIYTPSRSNLIASLILLEI